MKKNIITKILSLSVVMTLIIATGAAYFEPLSVSAVSVQDQVIISLNVDAGISITSPSDTYFGNSLGVSQSTAIATTTWNVKTNNSLGYSMSLTASNTPAMQQSNPLYVVEDFSTTSISAWSNVPTGRAMFGYSVYGTDTAQAKTGNDWGTEGTALCGATSTPSTGLKYIGLTTTTGTTTAKRTSTTTPTGIDTVVCFAVEQKNFYIQSGVYHATTTATAITL